jgi:hypothetical protein
VPSGQPGRAALRRLATGRAQGEMRRAHKPECPPQRPSQRSLALRSAGLRRSGAGPRVGMTLRNLRGSPVRGRAHTLHGPSYCGALSRSTFSLAPIAAEGFVSSPRSRTARWRGGSSPTSAFRRNASSPSPRDLHPASRTCPIRRPIEPRTEHGRRAHAQLVHRVDQRGVIRGRRSPCLFETRPKKGRLAWASPARGALDSPTCLCAPSNWVVELELGR